MTFPTDYDIENPLTKKDGTNRWLHLQIEQEKGRQKPNEIRIKTLEDQLEANNKSGFFDNINTYYEIS